MVAQAQKQVQSTRISSEASCSGNAINVARRISQLYSARLSVLLQRQCRLSCTRCCARRGTARPGHPRLYGAALRHDFSTVQTHVRTPAPVPARLAVGGQHDQFEHEADTVARQINHQPAPQSEGRYDFSTVLIHTDAKAGEAARLMNAHAFTVNHHVVFDPGQYAPHTPTGRHLLAHELTHVVQQTGGNQAQPSLVAQRLTGPCIQGRWRLDRVTPDIGREQSFTNGNGTARSTASAPDTGAKVFGSARAWQEQGWVRTEVGGEAQVSRQLNMHYIFKNDGQDNHFMQLRISGDIDGTAKAEDRLHAKAYGVTWGRITERTADNPAPARPGTV